MINRRKFPRFSPRWRVTYQITPEEPAVEQETIDISGRGIRFTANEDIAPGTIVSIELESPPLPQAIKASAKVIWCRQMAQAYEVGAEFQWIGWKSEIMSQGNFPMEANDSGPSRGESDEK